MSQLSFPSPCIFVLEPDDDARPLLKYNLQTWGYQVILALDKADALQRSQNGRERFDLILLNQFDCSIEESIAIGRQIRQNAQPANLIPIVVMAERYTANQEGQNIQVGDSEYVTYLEDGNQLKVMLYRLCPI